MKKKGAPKSNWKVILNQLEGKDGDYATATYGLNDSSLRLAHISWLAIPRRLCRVNLPRGGDPLERSSRSEIRVTSFRCH